MIHGLEKAAAAVDDLPDSLVMHSVLSNPDIFMQMVKHLQEQDDIKKEKLRGKLDWLPRLPKWWQAPIYPVMAGKRFGQKLGLIDPTETDLQIDRWKPKAGLA